MIRDGRCVVKSHCPNCPYFWGDFLGGGVKDSICVENLDLGPKITSTIWCFDLISGVDFFSRKMRIWRGYEFLIRVGRCVVTSHCPNCPYFGGDFLGKGVKDSICVEILDLAPKTTGNHLSCDGKTKR